MVKTDYCNGAGMDYGMNVTARIFNGIVEAV